jgi:CHASE2 domain-containing sensor protein
VVTPITTHASTDVKRTPFATGGGMPGAEVQANALDTILRGAPLRDGARIVDVLAIILLACVAAGAGILRSGRATVAVTAGTAIVFLAAVQLAFHAGWIVAVVAPLGALLLAASGVAMLTVGRALRRRGARSHSTT